MNCFTTNKSDHAQQHMWAAVVLMAVNDACPNSRPLTGPSLPRENSQQGRVLKALTMQRGGTLNSLRKAYAKWEQVAVELCRRLDLELIYRHDGHEVDGIVDANTKVFVRRRLPRAA